MMSTASTAAAGGLKKAALAEKSAFRQAFAVQANAAGAATGPLGLPRWALPVGAVALVGIVAFVVLRKKKRK
jgi:hypothetical protein